MSIRTGLIRLPAWLTTGVGVLLTTGIAVLAVGLVTIPRWFETVRPDTLRGSQMIAGQAARTWRRAAAIVADAKVAAGLLEATDAARRDALLGGELTPLVTTIGTLEAKRLTLSPRWAELMASELAGKGVGPGDVVAASFSGSFPALNLAVMAACDALGARLIAVSSVTASSFGATDPGFTWPELEARLVGAGVVRAASVAVSPGGTDDRALDLDADGQRLARTIAERAAGSLGAELLLPASVDEAVQARLRIYERHRDGRPIAVFINVGGTHASLGASTAILKVASGWLPPGPFDSSPGRGIVARMVEQGVPVLHLRNVRDLAVRWGVL